MALKSVETTAPVSRQREGLPRRGLRLPVGVTKQGRAATLRDDDQDFKIIGIALSGNDNLNAFQQDPGLGGDMVFDASDPIVRGRIMVRLRTVFNDFELQNRYRLLEDTIQWIEDPKEQTLALQFRYHNLETDDVKDFTKGFREGA